MKGDEDRVEKIAQELSRKVNEATSSIEATATRVPDMEALKSAIEQRQAHKLKSLGEDLRDWADTVREQIEEVLKLGEEVLLLAEDFEHADQAEAAEMNEDS